MTTGRIIDGKAHAARLRADVAQAHVGGIFHRHHERDVVGKNPHDVEIHGGSTHGLGFDALDLAHPLGRINHQLVQRKHLGDTPYRDARLELRGEYARMNRAMGAQQWVRMRPVSRFARTRLCTLVYLPQVE